MHHAEPQHIEITARPRRPFRLRFRRQRGGINLGCGRQWRRWHMERHRQQLVHGFGIPSVDDHNRYRLVWWHGWHRLGCQWRHHGWRHVVQYGQLHALRRCHHAWRGRHHGQQQCEHQFRHHFGRSPVVDGCGQQEPCGRRRHFRLELCTDQGRLRNTDTLSLEHAHRWHHGQRWHAGAGGGSCI